MEEVAPPGPDFAPSSGSASRFGASFFFDSVRIFGRHRLLQGPARWIASQERPGSRLDLTSRDQFLNSRLKHATRHTRACRARAILPALRLASADEDRAAARL